MKRNAALQRFEFSRHLGDLKSTSRPKNVDWLSQFGINLNYALCSNYQVIRLFKSCPSQDSEISLNDCVYRSMEDFSRQLKSLSKLLLHRL